MVREQAATVRYDDAGKGAQRSRRAWISPGVALIYFARRIRHDASERRLEGGLEYCHLLGDGAGWWSWPVGRSERGGRGGRGVAVKKSCRRYLEMANLQTYCLSDS